MVNFHFNGRYTLREINGIYCLYDRDINGLSNDTRFKQQITFQKAKQELLKYKLLVGDL